MYLPNGLTEKQELFCQEYLKNGFNGTQAAIKAGYSEETAKQMASENLTKPVVLNRIDELRNDIYSKIDEKWIVENINSIFEMAKESNKLADAIKSLELLGKWKAMFTDKQITQNETFEDVILKMANKVKNGAENEAKSDEKAGDSKEPLTAPVYKDTEEGENV